MASKLAAARIASWSGVTAVIAAASAADAVISAINGKEVGTRFLPHDRNLSLANSGLLLQPKLKAQS
jgi:glutamate 5-kinase